MIILCFKVICTSFLKWLLISGAINTAVYYRFRTLFRYSKGLLYLHAV